MNCTKCGGSGSEGYLSFLRCGRCGATGQEPEDALIPYSADLILVPDGPVITALKENPEVVKKKLDEASEKEKRVEAAPPRRTPSPSPGRISSAPSPSYGFADANHAFYNDNQSFNNGPPPEKKQPHVQPISQFFDIILRHPEHGVSDGHTLNFHFTQLSQDLYSQEFLLREISFDSKNKYMIKAHHRGHIFLEAFYTGLGVKAVIEGGFRLYPMQEITFGLEPQDKNPALLEDRVAMTVWIEKKEVEPMIHRPNYPGAVRGYDPAYGQR